MNILPDTYAASPNHAFEAKRRLIDQQLLAHAAKCGVVMNAQPLDAMPVKPANAPITPFTRFLTSPSFTKDGRPYRLVEYRFFPDPLFLFGPANRSVQQIIHLFRHHWFAPIKTTEDFTVTHYAMPVRAGAIPTLFGKPPEKCFANLEGTRIDCTVLRPTDLDWIPVQGGKTQDGTTMPPWAVAWDVAFAMND